MWASSSCLRGCTPVLFLATRTDLLFGLPAAERDDFVAEVVGLLHPELDLGCLFAHRVLGVGELTVLRCEPAVEFREPAQVLVRHLLGVFGTFLPLISRLLFEVEHALRLQGP